MMKRRRRRVSWVHATAFGVEITQTPQIGSVLEAWLLPPARVSFILNSSRANHLTVRRIVGNLAFSAINETAGALAPGDLEFYIRRDQRLEGTTGNVVGPFAEPPLPTAVTAWDVDENVADGTDPFLWTHRLFAPQANPVGGTVGAGATYSPTTAIVKRMFQPDIDLKVMRKLTKDEGLTIGVRWAASELLGSGGGWASWTNAQTQLAAAFRILAS